MHLEEQEDQPKQSLVAEGDMARCCKQQVCVARAE